MDKFQEIDSFFDSMKKKSLDNFIRIEGADLVEKRAWNTSSGTTELNIIRGKVFEKVSVCRTNKIKKIPESVNVPEAMRDVAESKNTEVVMKVFEICSHMSSPKVPIGNI